MYQLKGKKAKHRFSSLTQKPGIPIFIGKYFGTNQFKWSCYSGEDLPDLEIVTKLIFRNETKNPRKIYLFCMNLLSSLQN